MLPDYVGGANRTWRQFTWPKLLKKSLCKITQESFHNSFQTEKNSGSETLWVPNSNSPLAPDGVNIFGDVSFFWGFFMNLSDSRNCIGSDLKIIQARECKNKQRQQSLDCNSTRAVSFIFIVSFRLASCSLWTDCELRIPCLHLHVLGFQATLPYLVYEVLQVCVH